MTRFELRTSEKEATAVPIEPQPLAKLLSHFRTQIAGGEISFNLLNLSLSLSFSQTHSKHSYIHPRTLSAYHNIYLSYLGTRTQDGSPQNNHRIFFSNKERVNLKQVAQEPIKSQIKLSSPPYPRVAKVSHGQPINFSTETPILLHIHKKYINGWPPQFRGFVCAYHPANRKNIEFCDSSKWIPTTLDAIDDAFIQKH